MQEVVLSYPDSPSRHEVHRMFDRISRRYDLLNRVLSLGLDQQWRRRAVWELPSRPNSVILDLACGTGDVAITAASDGMLRRVLALDMAEQMLEIAATKLESAKLGGRIMLARADGHNLPLPNSAVDAVTIAFGIRNMADVVLCLREMARVVRPGGRAVILEFSLPANRLLRSLHLAYIRYIVPTLGRLLSGDASAYTYLNQTIETFPSGKAFCELMRNAGWQEVKARPLNGGIVSLYTGLKA